MACHEIAALRLGLMSLLGIKDESEREHELSELGDAASSPGPLASLLKAGDFSEMRLLYASTISDLETAVASLAADDPALPYKRALLILNRKIELELGRISGDLQGLYQELEEMHDFVHELFPKGQ